MDKEQSIFSQTKLSSRISLILSVFLFLMNATTAKAQLFDSGQILRAGANDANILLKEYLRPFGGGFGADLNSGWFTSAKPLGKFGFDLRISASASWVPQKDRIFDVTQLNLNSVSKKTSISALLLPQKCSCTLSTLRFLGLRAP